MKRRAVRSRGFTLVELMVSLVMGLIIALAAVALARTATTTFYEQARISGVEATVRAASERLRSDLSRASYMSTPNIQLDPRIARIPGAVGQPYRIPALADLQGIRILPANASVRGHAYTLRNGLSPHELHIAGNLTTDDVYRGQFMVDAGGGCGTIVRLSGQADPAVRRLFNGAADAAERQAMTEVAFMPGLRMSPPVAGVLYAVQVMDMRGCFHYLTVCGVAQDPTQPESVLLSLQGDGGNGILTTEATLGDVCGARVMEEVAIAPIQRVRWHLGVENEPRRLDPVLEGTGADKFNLYRQVLDASGVTPVGAPEVIAEHAVDMKFGLFVDSSVPSAPPTSVNANFESDDALFATWAGPVGAASLPNIGPQRIRSVRYRLAFRTPFPDRRADLPTGAGPPYITRYCMGPDPCTDWARVRTVISEVALLNQARANY